MIRQLSRTALFAYTLTAANQISVPRVEASPSFGSLQIQKSEFTLDPDFGLKQAGGISFAAPSAGNEPSKEKRFVPELAEKKGDEKAGGIRISWYFLVLIGAASLLTGGGLVLLWFHFREMLQKRAQRKKSLQSLLLGYRPNMSPGEREVWKARIGIAREELSAIGKRTSGDGERPLIDNADRAYGFLLHEPAPNLEKVLHLPAGSWVKEALESVRRFRLDGVHYDLIRSADLETGYYWSLDRRERSVEREAIVHLWNILRPSDREKLWEIEGESRRLSLPRSFLELYGEVRRKSGQTFSDAEDLARKLLIAFRDRLEKEAESPTPLPPPAEPSDSLLDAFEEAAGNGREVELFFREEKQKHAGRVVRRGDPDDGLFSFESNDATVRASMTPKDVEEQVVAIRYRQDDLTERYSRVPNPQFRDKSVNQSGKGGERMWVLVDFGDPRLTGFLERKIRPIRDRLDRKEIGQEEAAAAGWWTVRAVPYDKMRLYVSEKNQMYRVGDFIEKGVCNERGMLLQIVYQYLGIESRMEKGFLGERHAWVRDRPRDENGAQKEVISDPQFAILQVVGQDPGADAYQDDSTPFVQTSVKTLPFLVDSGSRV